MLLCLVRSKTWNQLTESSSFSLRQRPCILHMQTACLHLKGVVLQKQGKPHDCHLSVSNSSLSNLFYKVRRFLDGVFEIMNSPEA